MAQVSAAGYECLSLRRYEGTRHFPRHSLFPEMTYNEAGNEVTITVPLD